VKGQFPRKQGLIARAFGPAGLPTPENPYSTISQQRNLKRKETTDAEIHAE
jgi:hypothetical protein